MCFAGARTLSHMADTLPAYSSAFLAAVAPLLEVADGRLYRVAMQTIATDSVGGANYFLQNEPIFSFNFLHFFGFA